MRSNNQSSLLFEHFPVEILLQIFSFFSLRELVATFSGLNTHFDSIVRFVRDGIHTVAYNNLDDINLLQLFPTQIARLRVANVETVDFSSLVNLRALTLKYGTNVQFDSVRPQHFPMLEILHVEGKVCIKSQRNSALNAKQ